MPSDLIRIGILLVVTLVSACAFLPMSTAQTTTEFECRETLAYFPSSLRKPTVLSKYKKKVVKSVIFNRRLTTPNWEAFRTLKRRNGGGGSGQPRSVPSSSSMNLIGPTITFGNLTKSRIDANFTLSATSDSPGAITYTSGNAGLVTVSGTTADIVGTHGTVTITANQAASGNYAAGSATMTLTVYSTYCTAEPCINGGVCVPTLQGALTDDNYVCECPDHYSGSNCFMSDLNCQENGGDLFCFNSGNCIPSEDGGECDCINGFCGSQCTILPSQCD